MLLLIIGFAIVIFGLYYVPIKEAYYTSIKNTPKLFLVLVGIWVFTSMAYIPFVCNIFLEGLVKIGYMNFNEGEGATWFLLIGSLILYGLLYRVYTSRLRSRKENVS